MLHFSRRRWVIALVVMTLAALPTGLALAAVTGSLQVTVLDSEGETLPGANVVIEGPAQLGLRSMATNSNGTARFNAVAPGVYTVTVTSPAYGKIVQQNNIVNVDALTDVKIQLQQEMVETVTVTAQTPLVDVHSTSTGQELSVDFVDTLPTTRSYQANLALVPGVSADSNPSVHGSTDRDNLYLIDGVNTTDPVTSTFGSNINFEIIDQQQITTTGLAAEYGGVIGLVSNLVTKSGGNDWSAAINYFRDDADWAADVESDAIGGANTTSWDAAYTLGGPIVKEKLWHFTSWQIVDSSSETVTGTEEIRPPRVFNGDYYYGKLTWQMTPNHRLAGHVNGDPAEIVNQNAADLTISEDQFRAQDQGGDNYSLRYTGVLSPTVILEAQANVVRSDLESFPMYPDLGPNVGASGSTSQFGRYGNEQSSNRDRNEFKADLSWFKSTSWGDHNLKAGVQYSETMFGSYNINSGAESYTNRREVDSDRRSLWAFFDEYLAPYYGDYSYIILADRWHQMELLNTGVETFIGGMPTVDVADPYSYLDPADWTILVDDTTYDIDEAFTFDTDSENSDAAAIGWKRYLGDFDSELGAAGETGSDVMALYLQDDWRLGKWSVRLGARITKHEWRNDVDRIFNKMDTTISPRLGVTFDPKGDGRQKIYFHYGRLFDLVSDESINFPGDTVSPVLSTAYYFAPGDSYLAYRQVGGVGVPGAVLPPNGVDNPYTDSFILGWAGDLGHNKSLEVTVIKRQSRKIIEDLDPSADGFIGLAEQLGLEIDDEELQTQTLESLGYSDINTDGVVNEDDVNPDNFQFVYYNVPGGKRDFTGVDVTFRKRYSNNWQALASYSFIDFKGNVTTDDRARTVGDDPYLDPRLGYTYGPLDFDRRHTFKVFGSYRFDNGITIGGSARLLSGLRYGVGGIVSPAGNDIAFWDGDPAKIVDTLGIDREEFSDALGIPEENEAILDTTIVNLLPLDLKAGRGSNTQPWWWDIDLSFRWEIGIYKKFSSEVFVDAFNLLNPQMIITEGPELQTDSDLAPLGVTPDNITDRSIYRFQELRDSQNPRSFQLGVRFAF